MKMDLINMNYVKGAGMRGDRSCLDGTRVAVIDEISEWANGANVPQLFFLTGEAGTGKSSISHTVGQLFDSLGRLGAFFCFDRDSSTVRGPETLLPTISHELASLRPAFRSSLMRSLSEDPRVSDSMDIERQWEKLFVRPAQSLADYGPVLVIIDAFDECGSRDYKPRRNLLSILTTRAHELPTNIRLLVTSRPEPDIVQCLQHIDSVGLRRRAMSELSHTESDISRYVDHRLVNEKTGRQSLTESQRRTVVERSEGYFQWAYLACEVLLKSKGGLSITKRYERLLVLAPRKEDLQPLDRIYSFILSNAFDTTDDDAMNLYRSVMGQILAAFEPLSWHALDEIHQKSRHATEVGEDEVEPVISFMGSLFTGVEQRNIPIRPVHASVRDFLVDRDCSGPFFVDPNAEQGSLAVGSLHLLMEKLEFNVCKLPSSFLKNSEVPDLPQKISRYISTELSYACRFLGSHIHKAVSVGSKLALSLLEVHEFFQIQLLFWLEVLCIIDKLSVAPDTLLAVLHWLRSTVSHSDLQVFSLMLILLTFVIKTVLDPNHELPQLLNDTRRFLLVFGRVISESTPHLYISALPFIPEGCSLQRVLAPKFPGMLEIFCNSAHSTKWPSLQAVFPGHSECVNSVAFSSDGKWIASGSSDCTICIWDAVTGQSACEPLQGHDKPVKCVAFSLDGMQLVSASDDCTIRIWDVKAEKSVRKPLRAHGNSVDCVAFSPDGKYIVSSSASKLYEFTLEVWDAQIEQSGGKPLKEYRKWRRSRCIAYSPDGRSILSVDWDIPSLCSLNIVTGNSTLTKLKGLKRTDNCVAFSPDGRLVVSISSNHIIQIWNAETGQVASEPLQGHVYPVKSVTVSPNGRHVVSGSADGTIGIWDVEISPSASVVLRGEDYWVNSVAFSPDGKHIVSGSNDAMCIWDAGTGQSTSKPLQPHFCPVTHIIFSPDGQYIFFSSYDHLVSSSPWALVETGSFHLVLHPKFTSFSAPTGERVERVEYTSGSFTVSQDGKYIVSGWSNHTVRTWDAKTGQSVGEYLQSHDGSVKCVACSPDGMHIVSGSDNCKIDIWDTKMRRSIGKCLEEHHGSVNCVAFSPDGMHFVSGSDDCSIRIWDTETGKPLDKPLYGHNDSINSVEFSPDGKYIVSGSRDCTIRIWDAERGQPACEALRGHESSVNCVTFSRDGMHFASGSKDCTIRIWDAKIDEYAGNHLNKHDGNIRSMGLSLNNNPVPGSDDQAILIRDHPDSAHPLSFRPQQGHHGQNVVSWANDIKFMSDGWLVGPEKQLFMWIPLEYRKGLMFHRMQVLIGPDRPIPLDFSRLTYGTDWARCYVPHNTLQEPSSI